MTQPKGADDPRIDPRTRALRAMVPAPGQGNAGVAAQCQQVMGTTHGIEIFTTTCPEISRETARSVADFPLGTTLPFEGTPVEPSSPAHPNKGTR